jgi:hypothetical protein
MAHLQTLGYGSPTDTAWALHAQRNWALFQALDLSMGQYGHLHTLCLALPQTLGLQELGLTTTI